VLSDHHWCDPIAGLREMRRVARRVVVFQWDGEEIERFWLVRDYASGAWGASPARHDGMRQDHRGDPART
jgi:hypothetical protein